MTRLGDLLAAALAFIAGVVVLWIGVPAYLGWRWWRDPRRPRPSIVQIIDEESWR